MHALLEGEGDGVIGSFYRAQEQRVARGAVGCGRQCVARVGGRKGGPGHRQLGRTLRRELELSDGGAQRGGIFESAGAANVVLVGEWIVCGSRLEQRAIGRSDHTQLVGGDDLASAGSNSSSPEIALLRDACQRRLPDTASYDSSST